MAWKILFPLALQAKKKPPDRPGRRRADEVIHPRAHDCAVSPVRALPRTTFATLRRVKTLVIAEKPSVARDIVDALGRLRLEQGVLRGRRVRRHVRGWAPARADAARGLRRALQEVADSRPPDHPRGVSGSAARREVEEQLSVIHKLLKRDDIDQVINACDAGRGEKLSPRTSRNVRHRQAGRARLWISSMTKQAIREGFEKLGRTSGSGRSARRRDRAPSRLARRDERDAGGDDPRASLGRGRRLARAMQTPTLAMIVKREREIQAFVPERTWLVHATFDPRYEGLWFEDDETRLKDGKRADEIVEKESGRRDGSSRSSARAVERAPLSTT